MAKNGRNVIMCAETEINESNIVQLVYEFYNQHLVNRVKIQELYDYYLGVQLKHKKKKVRPEIDNRIIENHAYEIVDFKKGYGFSDPIQYVATGSVKDEDNSLPERINILNEYMTSEDKTVIDGQIAEWCLICGVGYRMTLPKQNYVKGEAPFEMESLDPRDTFVVYNNGFKKKPLMSVQIIKKRVLENDIEGLVERFCCYTDKEYFEVQANKVVKREKHSLGYIPIQEYRLNNSRIGAFEPVESLLEALNQLASDRLDGIEQFIQSLLVFENCAIDDNAFDEMREKGAIMVKSEGGNVSKVYILSEQLDQQQTQTLVDYTYQTILTVCGMPDRNGNGGTGDTGQAVILRDGWGAAEAMMKDYETVFKSCERQFLKYVLSILQRTDDINIGLRDIEPKFSRNRTDNVLTKAQALATMINAGVSPEKAYAICGLFSDPESAYLDSKENYGNQVQSVQQTVNANNTVGGNNNTSEVLAV